MNEDLVQAAKAAAELEPAIEAFAEATGALEPPREVNGWIAAMIRYRRVPHEAKLLMRAAEKIKASGLPAHAVSDKTLRAILEDGPLEDDKSMQERWANLLANAATVAGDDLRVAYPRILGDLEPDEARLLEKLFDEDGPPPNFKMYAYDDTSDLVDEAGLDNLERLGLVKRNWSTGTTVSELANGEIKLKAVQLTELGSAFVVACRSPESVD
jgi:hypothetical protein